MPITVDLPDAAARLEELITQVEAGQEVIVFRDGAPIAKLTGFDAERRRAALEQTIEDVRAIRARAQPATVEELIAWKNEGRRY
jgi:prevent-host-death family protein